MEFQKLTVHHYADNTVDDKRITISPSNVAMIAADVDDSTVNGRSVRHVTVLFLDGGSATISINHQDLETLEGAIGSFCLE
jgi:hypothetical protein